MRGACQSRLRKVPNQPPLLSGPTLVGQWDPESPRGTALSEHAVPSHPFSAFCPRSQASLSPLHTGANRPRRHVPQPATVCAGHGTWVPPQQASWAQPPGSPSFTIPPLPPAPVLGSDPDIREIKVKASAEPAHASSRGVLRPEGV